LYIYIYISPNSSKEIFLELLDETLNKVLTKGRFLVLCGDWNINLLEENTHQKALQSLLLSNNLQNTGSMSNSSQFKYMFLARCYDQKQNHSTTKVVEMGLSDHFVLVTSILVHSPSTCSKYVVKRIFSKRNIANFNDQLKIELWDAVYSQSDVNRAYCVFLSIFCIFSL
jgi:exonuclease III